MNTKILLIIGVVVIIGAGYLLFSAQDTREDMQTGDNTPPATQEPMDSPREVGSLQSLITANEDIRCTFSSEEESGISTGEFFYSSGKYRVEAETNYDGQVYQSNMIGTDEMVYVWGQAPGSESMAIMLPAEEVAGDGGVHDFAANQEGSGMDLEAKVRYDCNPWRPEESKFVPPTDVEFMDMQAMFEDMTGGGFPDGVNLPENLQVQ